MNDQQLATILEEALQRGRYERDDLYLFPIKLAWRMTNEAHVRDPERSIVFAAIEAHPDLAPILGMYLNTGLNAPQLTAPALGDWLLTRAMHMGAEEAVAELRSFIDAPHCDVDECFAFSGLQVSSPFSVASGLDLVPIESLPESELTISLSDPEWFYFGRDAGGRVRRKVPQVLASFGKSIWHVNPRRRILRLRKRD